MRKLIVFLALVGASVLFLGAAPGVASAGNCSSVYMDSTYYLNGQLIFHGYIGNCTSVSQVQYGVQGGCTGSAQMIGTWWDQTWTGNACATAYSGAAVQNILGQFDTAAMEFRVAPWCVHQTHWVYTYFNFRIKSGSISGGTWGPWHQALTGQYQIVC